MEELEIRHEIKADAIELPGERTKNGSPHTIPLTAMMRRVLDTLPGTGKFVLNGTDRPYGDHSGEGKGHVGDQTVDVTRSSPKLRERPQRLGIPPHIVELALNHRSATFSGVAGIYQRHRYAKEVAEAFAIWSRHIEALTAKKAVAA